MASDPERPESSRASRAFAFLPQDALSATLSLREVVDSISEGFAIFDREFRIVEINEKTLRLDTRKREDLIGQSHWDAFPGTENSELGRLYKQAMRDRLPASVEYRYVWPDGRERWFDIRVYPARDQHLIVFFLDVTERHLREHQLAVSEARFRAAVEAVEGLVWTNDAGGRMSGEQPGWAALTGQSYAECQGYGWADAVHPDDAQATIEAWQAALAERRPFEWEHRVRRHDGAWRRCTIRAVPVIDGTGAISEWVGVHTDVTDERAASERFRQLADTIDEVFYIHDLDSRRFEYVSPAYERVWQRKASDLLKNPDDYWQAIHPDDLATAKQATSMQLAGHDTDIRYRLLHPDGCARHIRDRAFVVQDPDGGARRVVGLAEDVTEATETRLQLARNAASFQALVEGNPFGVYVVDRDFRLRNISQGSTKVFAGIDPLIGRDFAEILRIIWTEPFASDAIARFRHTLATGEPYINPQTVERRSNIDATETYDWRIERIDLPDGTHGVVCYFYDLSERAVLEAQLRQALADKDVLLREVDHRVRNSLSMVAGLLSMQRTASREEETRDALASAVARVAAISRVHERLHKGSILGVVDFAEYLKGLCDDIHGTISRGDLSFEISAQRLDLPVESVVPLGIIANELIINACKYSDPDHAARILVELTAGDGGYVFAVSDAGHGMPADFDPHASKGLGLRVIATLARQLGGKITYPAAGGPARFAIEVPLPQTRPA